MIGRIENCRYEIEKGLGVTSMLLYVRVQISVEDGDDILTNREWESTNWGTKKASECISNGAGEVLWTQIRIPKGAICEEYIKQHSSQLTLEPFLLVD